MIATPANLMLLDEPTNHLDMTSQEVLQEAMRQYDGTIIVVSHNRYFLDCFVNKVLEVKDGGVVCYEGNVAEYQQKQSELVLQEMQKNNNQSETAGSVETTARDSRKQKRREEAKRRQERQRVAGGWLKKLAEAEKEVESLESQKADLEALMADPELYQDQTAWNEASSAYEECSRRLERWLERWETAQSKIDEIDEALNIS